MDEIKLKSQMTEQDYKKVSYYNAFLRKPLTLILMVVVFLAGLIGLVFPNLWRIPLPFAIIFILYPFFLIIMSEVRIRKIVANRKKSGDGKQMMGVSENGITCIKTDVHEVYDWGKIKNFYETPNYFLAYTSTSKILTLPKRDIDKSEVQGVRNIIINNLAYRDYRIKK